MSDRLWKDNAVQFPRLIAEINACVDFGADWDRLLESLDISNEELCDLFDRADKVNEENKKRHCPICPINPK